MSKIISRLLALFLLCLLHPDGAGAQQGGQPLNLKLGDAVVTGFSGTLRSEPAQPAARNKAPNDFTFINPDGPSVRVIDVSRPGYVWDGRLFAAPKTFDAFAKDVGQVFGVALDDSEQPNIYVAATSVFGLNIVVRGRDGKPERRKKGAPGAGWMKGQFGLDLQGGPGSIYKIDGRTGVPMLFANVTLNGVPNPGPGLGNLAFDAAHKQLFVSDLHTGMIHRFALDGKELGAYDHGVSGLGAAKLAAVPFNPANRPNIASDRFDSEKPDSWGFALAARRVWGLAVHEGRLYYSVVSGPQIWSVGIERDGSFAADPRWELDVPAQAGPLPISDIAFSQQGAMILAQRALIAGAYDYSAFTRPGEPQVLRVWLKGPNDPPSPGRWKLTPEEYAIGYAGNNRNSNGGVALGYGYDQGGTAQPGSCEAALWTTGQNLRNNPALRSQLEPGGPLLVHGLQGSPIDMVRPANTPPATSYFVDYDDKFDDANASGHMGSVRIFAQPCAPSASIAPVATVVPIATPIGCVGPNCRNTCTPTCVCPPGTVLQGKECVKTDACPPPMVPGPIPGQCICPPGYALHDKECVRIVSIAPPHSCLPPLVLDPLTGLCVPPKQECVPPLVLDPVTHTCVCPPGTVQQGRLCVPQICPPPLVPGPCECPEGTVLDDGLCVRAGKIIVKKEVTTHGTQIPWPNPGPLFPMTLTCFAPPQSWSFSLNNNGTYTANNIPFGKTCTVAEGAMPPFPPNLCPRGTVPVWTPPPFTTPASVVINGTTVTMIVHNTVTCEKREAELAVTKKVSPDPRGIGNTLSFPMVVTCTNPNSTHPLTVNGNTSTLPFNVPVGSNCSVTETLPPLPAGCTWLAPIFSPASVPIVPGLNLETVTNGYTCRDLPVDVKIEKTGGTTPFCPAPYYSFTIKVTNGPNPWPGTGNVVVTDTVPANMTFGPIAAPGWSCNGLSPPAGTTFTCTYTGPALAANQVLPVITIPATPLVGPPFPPFTNCASVAIPSSSGYADSNSANNNSCTTVSKPSSCTCPPPQVMNIDGICVNPPPVCTAPQVPNADGICACPAPMQPGAVPGQCICPLPNVMVNGVCVPPPPVCPQGQVLVGGACVSTPPVCTAPQVPNADGICACPAPMQPGPTPGSCKCPQGMTLVGGACVRPPPPVRKQPDKVKKPQACPEGTTRQGGKCVKRERNEPRVTPNDVRRGIDIFRGIPGSSGGGGGGGGGGSSPGKR